MYPIQHANGDLFYGRLGVNFCKVLDVQSMAMPQEGPLTTVIQNRCTSDIVSG